MCITYILGEAVAYYFAWMNFYTTCVLIPAILGIVMYLFCTDGVDIHFNPYLPIFAYFMAIWGVIYTIVSYTCFCAGTIGSKDV